MAKNSEFELLGKKYKRVGLEPLVCTVQYQPLTTSLQVVATLQRSKGPNGCRSTPLVRPNGVALAQSYEVLHCLARSRTRLGGCMT